MLVEVLGDKGPVSGNYFLAYLDYYLLSRKPGIELIVIFSMVLLLLTSCKT